MQSTNDSIFILVIIAIAGTLLLVVSFILINIRNQNRLLKQRQRLQKAELEHQKELLNAVIESQEIERKRVGRDLHDDVGTALSSLRLIIDMFNPEDTATGHKDFISSTKNIIDKVIKDVRNISHNLSPTTLSYYGLVSAVEEHCNYINQSGKLCVTLVNDAAQLVEQVALPAATALYRVLEELLNNTIKHAGATETSVIFSQENDILLITYKDNGKGIDSSVLTSPGMGLQNIESRLSNIGAVYTIDTAAGKGFAIQIKYTVKA
ncbi:hypothetical protein GCM10023149_50780 [Mucilaginibacter gynuensis]|uniref:histidine kinase n=1 Tax=Mucilaginibacter gynuensis TaxID=1302236 RepID=A0ABP8HIH9_9SPHI